MMRRWFFALVFDSCRILYWRSRERVLGVEGSEIVLCMMVSGWLGE